MERDILVIQTTSILNCLFSTRQLWKESDLKETELEQTFSKFHKWAVRTKTLRSTVLKDNMTAIQLFSIFHIIS